MAQPQTVLMVEPGDDFVVTPFIDSVCERGLAYLGAGYPVHLSGPAGTGKTTLAMRLAGLLERSVVLVCGDEEFGSSDLVGGPKGVVSKRLVDNFIHTVLKTEESVRTQWVDQRLTTACKLGCTLVYDEFSRSHAEANNALLSILEEGLLPLPDGRPGESYLRVHPAFRAIFTSNPDEYAGVYTPQSALLDRMITIKLDGYDRETEIAITVAKSGLSPVDAAKIVDLVRVARDGADSSRQLTVRACIMIGQIVRSREARVGRDDPIFMETCFDVLDGGYRGGVRLDEAVEAVFGRSSRAAAGSEEQAPRTGSGRSHHSASDQPTRATEHPDRHQDWTAQPTTGQGRSVQRTGSPGAGEDPADRGEGKLGREAPAS